MNAFCTIVSADYIGFAKTLYASLKEYDPDARLFVLISSFDKTPDTPDTPGIRWMNLPDVLASHMAKKIVDKYLHTTSGNELRWALKPVLLSHLLSTEDKLIYVDADIYFVGQPGFLFGELDHHSVILTPHWLSISPENPEHLSSLLRGGYFNAGFIGVSKKGLPAINWWAEACHFTMGKMEPEGFYDDQKYLDLIPWEFANVKALEHKGCNLAAWNIERNKREMINGRLIIEKKYEPVFIHFSNETIKHIMSGHDKLLLPYLEKYRSELLKHHVTLDHLFQHINFKPGKSSFLVLKHKLLVRTRIKRLLYKIAERL